MYVMKNERNSCLHIFNMDTGTHKRTIYKGNSLLSVRNGVSWDGPGKRVNGMTATGAWMFHVKPIRPAMPQVLTGNRHRFSPGAWPNEGNGFSTRLNARGK